MIKNLFWDLDGTLFDTYPAINAAFVQALADLGGQTTISEVSDMTSVSLTHCINTLAKQNNIDPKRLDSYWSQVYAAYPLSDQPPFAGAKELCQAFFDSGGKNYIVTHRGPETTKKLLDQHQMVHLFSDWISPKMDYPRKPDPTMFNVLLAKHNLHNYECLMIGDRDLDLAAAQSAGMASCGFGKGFFDLSAKWFVTDFLELKKLIWQENNW